jgi:membrane-associated phospholipid phosphatase
MEETREQIEPADFQTRRRRIARALSAAVVNRASKISLHMTFVAFCTVVVLHVSPELGACFAALALAVAWSRVALSRHTRLEAIGGLLLGATGGIATAWL